MSGIIENLKIISLIALASYPLIRFASFKRVVLGIASLNEKLLIGATFGLLSVLGMFTGVDIFNDIKIQSSLIGPLAGGIFGGPVVGITAGVIGAVYRLLAGNVTIYPESLSIFGAGLLSELFFRRQGKQSIKLSRIYLYGLIVEFAKLQLIMQFMSPRILSHTYFSMIGIQMLIINPLGLTLLVSLIKDIKYNQNLTGASYAEKSMEIAKQSLDILSNGFDKKAMERIVKLIYKYVDVTALSFRGADGSNISIGKDMSRFDAANIEVEDDRKGLFNAVDKSRYERQLELSECEISNRNGISVLKVPLRLQKVKIGELHFYKSTNEIVPTDIKMIEGIASLLSTQIQNTQLHDQEKLLIQWKYSALKAQVNPHFLYNTLNVIKTMIRLDPEKSQDLIINLANFYRGRLSERGDMISFLEELKLIKSYMDLQEARFGDKVAMSIDVDPGVYEVLFPSFTIQPLIENSIIHGMIDDESHILHLHISAKLLNNTLLVYVSDNGRGFDQSVINNVGKANKDYEGGIGLDNINMRLRSIYQDNYTFSLQNTESGALVTIIVPEIYEGEVRS